MAELPPVTEWPYRDPEPRAPMEASEVARLAGALEDAGIAIWLDGGWGVDALIEGQTREHDDLDLVVALADVLQSCRPSEARATCMSRARLR